MFDTEKFKATIEEIKNQKSWMSPLRTAIEYSIAANMMEQAVNTLLKNEKI